MLLSVFFFFGSVCLFAQSDPTDIFEDDSSFTGKGMTRKELCNFFMDEPVNARKSGSDEWITFDDWTSPKKGDTVTFHLKNGTVVDYQKSK